MNRIHTILVLSCLLACQPDRPDDASWPDYLGGPDRNHFSSLTQITPRNVAQLKQVWSYAAPDSGQMPMSPIVVDGVLYGMPAAAFATPITYQIQGKQYVVVACGGEKLGTPKGNQIVAFAL